MKNVFHPIVIVIFLMASISCSSKKSADQQEEAKVTEQTPEIYLTPITDSPEFADAILNMNNPEEFAQIEAGKANFAFDVKNFTLAEQTSDATTKNCANSKDGQHIHLILNNEPYTAHYESEFSKELKPGHYVSLAFLSRSYHESIKNPEAYVLRQFSVGKVKYDEVDLSAPMMFYSRPKGIYTGDDTKKLLLDFYLVNTDLAPDGNKVRATINGKAFMIDKWVPHFVEGLTLGPNKIKLELLDKDGNLIETLFNPVEREVFLEEVDVSL